MAFQVFLYGEIDMFFFFNLCILLMPDEAISIKKVKTKSRILLLC